MSGPGAAGYRAMIDKSAAGRVGTPDEVATVAAFLLGPDAAFITAPISSWTADPRQVHAAAWINAGWIVQSVKLTDGMVVFAPGRPEPRPQLKRASAVPDGAAQLATVLERAGYPSTMHAVAAHVTMIDPTVVRQTGGQAMFATVRRDVRVSGETVGSIGTVDGESAMFDDNHSPTVAFLWAAGLGQPGRDMQYNHIWPSSRDRSSYTALWNLCSTPAFLAKTTDGRNHPDVVAALRRRSFDLYGCLPVGAPDPIAPDGFDELTWASHPRPVADLESVYRMRMATKPLDRVVVSARQIGWRFSNWQPDGTL